MDQEAQQHLQDCLFHGVRKIFVTHSGTYIIIWFVIPMADKGHMQGQEQEQGEVREGEGQGCSTQ